MDPNDTLIQSLLARDQKKTEFNRGILTADHYVKTLEGCVGSDLCYRYASKGNVSFSDAMKRASKTLTYNNDDMVVEEKASDKLFLGDTEIELPKNTLMVFKHVLTTSRKDRDGDILRTQGAKLDPKMLLLWQHVHTLPIGKMVAVAEHTSNKLSLITAIVDLNELAHDAAVMIDNDMGRFSHGFRALEFDDIKEDEGETTSPGGFDIKIFEIMEESLVSVPANVDSDTEEVLLSLIEGGKLTSGIMKGVGETVRERRPKRFSLGGIDNENGNGKETSGKGNCSCPSKETDEDTGKSEEGNTKDTEVKSPVVLDEKGLYSGSVEGSFEFIRNELDSQTEDHLESNGIVSRNRDGYLEDGYTFILATFKSHVLIAYEVYGNRPTRYFQSSYSMKKGKPKFTDTLVEVEIETKTEVSEKNLQKQLKISKALSKNKTNPDVKMSMETVLAYADSNQRKQLISALQALDVADNQSKKTGQFKALYKS